MPATLLRSSARTGNATADRAIEILLLFDEQRLSLSAEDISRRLKTHRSTAYRYLQSLLGYGLLEEDVAGAYRLGPRVLQLARLFRRGVGLSELALPTMYDLADRTTETVLLTRLFDEQVVCLERVDRGDQVIRIVYERGQILPVTVHMGASARVLLAYLPPERQRAILSGVAGLRLSATLRELSAIRAAGHAVAGPDPETHVRGVAAPVFDADGSVRAALGVVAPSFRIPDEVLSTYADLVVQAAAAISDQLAALDR